ncbi:hypothetical protein ACHHYP_10634 [Achlya hypogyna]|uniref:Uncharacterized protein n=1 Tax=Achlya hypogyna TaxID=1202772 RepID=A0A1V9YKT4_ACHHY|nr:hypothetical protein ACHHYP_10634 [Achlya hypogyna]
MVELTTKPSDTDEPDWFEEAEAVIDYLGDNSPNVKPWVTGLLSNYTSVSPVILSRSSSLTYITDQDRKQCIVQYESLWCGEAHILLPSPPSSASEHASIRPKDEAKAETVETKVDSANTTRQLQSNLDLAVSMIASLQSQLATAHAPSDGAQISIGTLHLRKGIDTFGIIISMQASEATALKAADAAVRTVDVLREQLRVSSQEQLARVAPADTVDTSQLQMDLASASQTIVKLQWELEAGRTKDRDRDVKVAQLEQQLFQSTVDVAAKSNELAHLQGIHRGALDELALSKESEEALREKQRSTDTVVETLTARVNAVEGQLCTALANAMTWQTEATAKAAQLAGLQAIVPRLHTVATRAIALAYDEMKELAQLRTEWQASKRAVKHEIKKTQSFFLKWSTEGTEVAIAHNEREVALEAKHAKIAQWQYQVKAEKLRYSELQQQLWKANSAYERDMSNWRSEYERLREHVNVMLEVKASLATEVRTSFERIQKLEATAAQHEQLHQRLKKKNESLVQQVQILQHTHARELERLLLRQGCVECENQRAMPPDWEGFVDLLAVYREEIGRTHK